VVSFDDFELSELMPVPVTVIDHDARLLGREAATLLFARLEGTAEAGATTVELPVTIAHP
jgi:LacI family transcriptional regulator